MLLWRGDFDSEADDVCFRGKAERSDEALDALPITKISCLQLDELQT